MKVAYFSPMPPERSGIADYWALLLPALRERCGVAVVKRRTQRPPLASTLRLPRRQQPGGARLGRVRPRFTTSTPIRSRSAGRRWAL